MTSQERFGRWVFLLAAVYGLVVLLPQYFLEGKIGRDYPPPITHPEHFYGFIGVALAWQIAFLLIARDVRRYRIFMIPSALEKLSFGVAVLVLHAQDRIPSALLAFGLIDLMLCVLFLVAFRLTREH
jgi:hypothetical protein